jgi:hypothetical protein
MRRVVFTLGILAAPRAALACPVCFGQNDSPMALATNAGVIAMLIVVVAMLASFASFFIYLARRARFAAEAEAALSTQLPASGPQEGTVRC